MYSGRKYWGAFSHSDFWLEGKGRSESVALQTLEHLLADLCHHRSSYCRRKRHTNCISFMIPDCSRFMTVLFTLKENWVIQSSIGFILQKILGSVPGSGRSPGEGNGYHSSIFAWRIPWKEESGGLQRGPWGHKKLDVTERLTLSLHFT